jgi:hypothetical protein
MFLASSVCSVGSYQAQKKYSALLLVIVGWCSAEIDEIGASIAADVPTSRHSKFGKSTQIGIEKQGRICSC